VSDVTKLSVDMLDLPEISFEDFVHTTTTVVYVPRGDGTYRSAMVSLGWLQTLFNRGAPGGDDQVTIATGGEIGSGEPETVFWVGGQIDVDSETIKLSGGTIL
jgi:hypothetical protein